MGWVVGVMGCAVGRQVFSGCCTNVMGGGVKMSSECEAAWHAKARQKHGWVAADG